MPTEKEQIESLTTELNKTKGDLKTANDALTLATQEIERLKVANPKDGVDLAQKNLRIDLDNVSRERDSLKTENQQLKQQLLKESQERDAINRAKIIGDLKTMGCTLSDKELNAMGTDELDSLRDASQLFKREQPSVGLKPFGEESDSLDPNSRITVPSRFLSSLKTGGNP